MNTATMSLLFGIVFVVVGLSGFFAAPPPPDAPPLTLAHGHGMALGLFQINTLHNAAHIQFGLMGVAASRGALMSPRAYFQFVAVAYVLLTVLGLMPATNTTFGLMPLWGNDVWLHALIAAAAAYFGFVAPAAPVRRM